MILNFRCCFEYTIIFFLSLSIKSETINGSVWTNGERVVCLESEYDVLYPFDVAGHPRVQRVCVTVAAPYSPGEGDADTDTDDSTQVPQTSGLKYQSSATIPVAN